MSFILHLFIVLYRLDRLYKRLKRISWVGKPDGISGTAWEVLRFPYDVLHEINDQELLYKLAELVDQCIFIIGRDTCNTPVRNWLNKQ